MVQSLNQRLGLNGLDEIRRGLANVATEGQQSGNTIRQALLNATGQTQQFNQELGRTEVSARATRYAIQNLTFQVNDVVTSLASGISPFRTLTQQGGQFVQLFQQGGGVGNVLGGFATRLAAVVTPTRLAVAGIATLAAGIAALAIRAENSELATQRFDVQLRAVGKTGGVTGKELEEAAHRLDTVGVSAAEARKHFSDFIAAGGNPQLAETVVRAGANLNAVLGEGSLEKFIGAAAQGGEALKVIARQLGIVTDNIEETNKAFVDFTEENRRLNFEIQDSVIKRNRAIVDNQRHTNQEIRDLTRELGTERAFPGQEDVTQRREILVQSARRELEIRRQNEEAISDMLRLAARRRNEENRKALDEYNKAVLERAQKEAEAAALILQISQKVEGARAATLGPLGTAIQNLTVEWNHFLDAITKTAGLAEGIHALERFFAFVSKLQTDTGLPGLAVAATAAGIALYGLSRAMLVVSATPMGRVIAAISLAIVALVEHWDSVGPTILKAYTDYIYPVFKALSDFFTWIINKAIATNNSLNSVGDAIAHAFGGRTSTERNLGAAIDRSTTVGANEEVSTGEVIRRAMGGLVYGPGSDTSDSILTRISNGEYVVNAAATRMNLPLLNAINSMNRPIARSGGFAAGGLVTAAAGMDRSSFTLVIEGRQFNGLSAPSRTAKDMLQFARTSSLSRASKTPSWDGAG